MPFSCHLSSHPSHHPFLSFSVPPPSRRLQAHRHPHYSFYSIHPLYSNLQTRPSGAGYDLLPSPAQAAEEAGEGTKGLVVKWDVIGLIRAYRLFPVSIPSRHLGLKCIRVLERGMLKMIDRANQVGLA